MSHFLYNILSNLWVWGKVSIIFKCKSTSEVSSHRGVETLSFAAVSVRTPAQPAAPSFHDNVFQQNNSV